MSGAAALRICFIVESGTDVRLVDGLAERVNLTVLARAIPGGVPISRTPRAAVEVQIGPASRPAFARFAARQLLRLAPWDHLLIQGYGLSALVANIIARTKRLPATMLVCSPVERYYRCRRDNPVPGMAYHAAAHAAVVLVARLNGAMARQYVVLSRYLEEVVRHHGTSAPVHIVPVYGVDTTIFRPTGETRADVRRRLGLPEPGALLFYSSRVAPEKDSATVLRTLALLAARGHDVRLLHRSGGWRMLESLARDIGVADRVIATDAVHPQHELPDSYRAADLCVQASLDEGLGFSPLEALACGTPVVATRVGGLRETVVDGVTGWSVPPRDPEALADAVTDIMARPDVAAQRTEEGMRLVAARFERQAVFDQLHTLLARSRS